MQIPQYTIPDLEFAYRCYVYFRWHTDRRKPINTLTQLTSGQLESIHPDVHVLELTTSNVEMTVLASLRPTESVSTAASKLKGAASKTIGELSLDSTVQRRIAKGYFAATTGHNTSDVLEKYLDRQSQHHGYDQREVPPIHVQEWHFPTAELRQLQAVRAVTVLQWHIVISTWNRTGVLTTEAGRAIGDEWARRCAEWNVRFRKVSMVPDHIHAAVWSHPSVAPAEIVVRMLNTSQILMCDQFEDLLLHAGQPQLWKPGAYIGSYGDISKNHLRNYIRRLGQIT